MTKSKSYFNKHWSEYQCITIPKEKILRAQKFLLPAESLFSNDAYVLDCGCGDGVHAHYLHQRNPNILYHGIDVSESSISRANINSGFSNFRVGDVTNIPFSNDTFDCTFSYGVIAYTKSPDLAFSELIRVTKPNGLIGLWCCTFDNAFIKYSLLMIRLFCKYGGKRITNMTLNSLVPLLHFIKNDSGINLSNSTWEQCKEVLSVNIAPPTLHLFTSKELLTLMKSREDINPIETACKNGSIWAIKKSF